MAERLADAFGMTVEELTYSDLVGDSGTDVLLENLRYLMDTLERGGKKELAERLGVDPSTISRWMASQSRPQPRALRDLGTYFGLPPSADLRRDPLFLSLDPVSVVERRRWLQDRIGDMSPEELKDLYPALRRLLGDS